MQNQETKLTAEMKDELKKKVISKLQEETNDIIKDKLQSWQKSFSGKKDLWFFIYPTELTKPVDITQTIDEMKAGALLRISAELGIIAPNVMPGTEEFVDLNNLSTMANKQFEEAYKNVYVDPKNAIVNCTGTLESIMKNIIKKVTPNEYKATDTITPLVIKTMKLFENNNLNTPFGKLLEFIFGKIKENGKNWKIEEPGLILKIANIRNNCTQVHGHIDGDQIIDDPLYSKFIVNTTASIGILLFDFYNKFYQEEASATTKKNGDSSLEDVER